MGRTSIDRPWRRGGRAAYAVDRVRRMLRPPVVVSPAPATMRIDHDVEIEVRDGTILRANVHRPPGDGPVPVILSAHPYGKDGVPERRGRRYRLNMQFRMLRQPSPVHLSDATSWEAPDPAHWTSLGYAVVNLDVRGAGRSNGVGDLLSDLEARDIHDVIEWIAAQPWCDGGVAMMGVSYLAISQYKAAATRPPHLRAIVPWEGFTDAYRDLFHPGGVRELGFSTMWTTLTRRTTRMHDDVGRENAHRPLDDDWWRALVPDLGAIEVPMLVCGSFSDNDLHTRGSFRAFARTGSAERHLYTHRSGKWAAFYGADARAAQESFLDRHLRGGDTPPLPVVRLEVRESRDVVHAVRAEAEWPLARTVWTTLQLDPERGLVSDAATAGAVRFSTRRDAASFSHVFAEDTEITGPAELTVHVRMDGADDASLFVGLSKWRGGAFVPFEGSYGFGRDLVTTGWQSVALRGPAPTIDPHVPEHDFRRRLPVRGRTGELTVALGPSATFFRAGEELRLHVGGRQLSPRNPLFGAFPGIYRGSPRARVTILTGPQHPSRLTLPVIPR